jgi:hypothetical protein
MGELRSLHNAHYHKNIFPNYKYNVHDLNVKTNRTNSQCDMGNIINIRCRAIQDINIFLGQGYYGQFACHLTVLGSKIDGSVI